MNESNPNLNSEPHREEALFQAAAQLSGAERAAFLNGACHGDPALRQRLEAILAEHEKTDALPVTAQEAARPTMKLELTDTPDEAVGQMIGRYKLLEKVGEGGCGVVYVAEQTQPVRRRVALKVIKLGMDTRAVVARFEAERQALAMMDHPNIAKVLDAGTTETGRPYFVMELVRGIRITDYCDQNHLTTKERLDLFIKVCQAIQHAHQKGIIHRDIKPSNILVTMHDGVPVPKVIDFGIAKATEGRLTDATVYTQLHQFIGTPAYMSPEQAEMSGLDIDTRSDIYGLGVLLYELLAGSTPFDPRELMASGIDAMRKTIREKEPMRPSTRVAMLKGEELTTTAKRRSAEAPKLIHLLKGDLDWIVMKCLEKDRTHRYETANGLALDVQRYLRQEPISAVAPSTTYRLRKFARRHRAFLTAACVMVGLLVAGILVSSWQAYRAMRFANFADTQRREADKARVAADRARVEAENARANEAAERQKVQEKSQQLAETLSQQEQQKISEVLSKEGATKALPLLALALRRNPENFRAASRLLSVLSHQDVARLISQKKYDGHLYHTCYGALGPLVLTSTGTGDLWLWDYRKTEPLAGPLPHAAQIVDATFTPSGRKFLVTLTNWHVEVFTTTNSAAPMSVLPMERSARLMTFSPDESRLVTQSPGDGGDYRSLILQVWDLSNGRPLTDPIRYDATGFGVSVSFTRGGTGVILEERVGMQRIRSTLDIATGKVGPKQTLANIVYFEDEGSSDRPTVFQTPSKGISISTPEGTREILLPLVGVTEHRPYGEAPIMIPSGENLSPDQTELLTQVADGTLSLWDVGHCEVLPVRIPMPSPSASANNTPSPFFELSPDGRRLLTVDRVGTAKIWNAQSGKVLVDPLAEAGKILFARLSPDGQKVLVAATNGWMRLWESSTGNAISGAFGHEPGAKSTQDGVPLVDVSFSRDGSRLAALWRNGKTQVWDAQAAKLVKEVASGGGGAISAYLSPNGQWLATVHQDRTVRVWDVATGAALCPPLKHDDGIKACQFSPDGRKLAIGSSDKTVRIWDLPAGQPALRPLLHDAAVNAVFWHPDGGSIVTVSGGAMGQSDQHVLVWDIRSGAVLQTIKEEGMHQFRIKFVTMSQDGRFLLIINDYEARLWDIRTGTPLSETITVTDFFRQRSFSVQRADPGLAFEAAGALSADGGCFAASTGESLKVWELPRGSGPAPDWLPRLAEAVAGQRVNEQGVSERVAPAEFLGLRRTVVAATSDDGYHRWGRWFFADRGSRAISPGSSLTIEGYVKSCIEENTVSSLQEALRLDPGNPKAVAGYLGATGGGISLTDQQPTYIGMDEASIRRMNLSSAQHAERIADRLLEAIPDSSLGWQVKAVALYRLEQNEEALAALAHANPVELGASFWRTKVAVLEKLSRNDEAYEALTKGIEMAKAKSTADAAGLLLERSRLLKQQNRMAEAGKDASLALGIPARDPTTRSNLIDLSACYTGSLTNVGYLDAGNDALSELPLGVHPLGGTEFDIRGIIYAQQFVTRRTNIASIPVGMRCRALQFLHSASSARRNLGLRVANYTVHFANDQSQEIPVLLGRHLFDWFFYPEQPEATEAPTVWAGLNERARGTLTFTRLFRMTWVNPFPEVEIKSIDFESLPTGVTPFLVALTADTGDSPAPALTTSAQQEAVSWQTLETIHRASVGRSESLGFADAEAVLLQRAGRTDEALAALSKLVANAEAQSASATNQSTAALEARWADFYYSVGRYQEAIALQKRACELNPQDTFASLVLGTWQTWFGQDAAYEGTRRRLVQQAEGTAEAATAERAAKAACLRPCADTTLLAKTLNLAQRAVDLGQRDPYLPWFQLGLGMSEYRGGQYAAAERSLINAVQTGGETHEIPGIARSFLAMSIFRQNRPEEARKVLSDAEAQMPPLPKDESKPLVDGRPVSHDVLIWWLAYKEAKSVITEPSAKP